MDNCIEFFNTFLKTELKPFMKNKNFKISGQHFYLERDDLTAFISIEKSSWNFKDSFTFCFKATVFDKVAYKYLGEYSKIPKIPHNTLFNIIDTSVIALKSEKTDRYSLGFDSDIEEFKTTIFSHLQNILIPFVESLKTGQDLIPIYKDAAGGFIGPGIFLDLAIGFHLLEYGDRANAIKYITKWIKEERKRGYWNDVVDSLEQKLEKGEF